MFRDLTDFGMDLLQNQKIGPYFRKFSTNSPAICSQFCENLSSISHFFVTTPQVRQTPRSRPFDSLRNQQGAALLVVLILAVILGLGAGIAGVTWKTTIQRAKEKELLFRGEEYRKAIESYFLGNNIGQKGSLPSNLESLLKDPRSLHTVRHIRKLYPDPMTGEEWFVIRDKSKKIIGVRSTSTKSPFKKDGFDPQHKKFSEAETYQDWEFVYTPEQTQDEPEETSPSPFAPSPFVPTP